MTTQIQLRRDTAANWAAANPVLAEGEIGMDMTVNAFKVGDGSSAWNDIDYAGTDISLDEYYTKAESDDAFQPKGDYLTDFVEEDPTVPDHVKGITQDDIDGWNAGGGGSGNGNPVVISDNPPASPEEGDLWYSSKADDEGLYCYDGEVWFEAGGANGADGEDGKQIWSETTPDGDIFYDKGSVSVSGDVSAAQIKASGVIKQTTVGYGLMELDGTDTSTEMHIRCTNHSALRFQNYNGQIMFQQGTDSQNIPFRIKDDGNAIFTGSVSATSSVTADTLVTNRPNNGYFFKAEYGSTGTFSSFNHSAGNTLEINPLGGLFKVNGDATFTGSVTVDGNRPVSTKLDLINTLATLRNATKDETTLEGLRDSIGNAIGGLIENLEHEIAVTMEISE